MLSAAVLSPPVGSWPQENPVKIVRVLLAAVAALAAAAALQFGTSSAAGAVPSRHMCVACWEVSH